MKVTCISCHKKFDNDKYYGICPKCGAFNKLHLGVDEHERYHQMYDDDKMHIQSRLSMSSTMKGMIIRQAMLRCQLPEWRAAHSMLRSLTKSGTCVFP